MSFLTISYARKLSLVVVVGNCLGDDVGEGVAGVAVDGLGADI